jgi:hypothetical protein
MTEEIDKKLREAQFQLGEMRKYERMAFGDRERFDFALSLARRPFLACSCALTIGDLAHTSIEEIHDNRRRI